MPAGRLFETKKFTERMLRTICSQLHLRLRQKRDGFFSRLFYLVTWGGRWGAIDVLCEALFGELFRIFRVPHSMREKFSRGLPETFGGLQGPSRGFLRLFREKIKFSFFHIFSSTFNIKQFFVMGEVNFLTTLSETPSGKRRLHFERLPSRGLYLERHSTLGEGSISLLQV